MDKTAIELDKELIELFFKAINLNELIYGKAGKRYQDQYGDWHVGSANYHNYIASLH